jgi:hypothetical protein
MGTTSWVDERVDRRPYMALPAALVAALGVGLPDASIVPADFWLLQVARR